MMHTLARIDIIKNNWHILVDVTCEPFDFEVFSARDKDELAFLDHYMVLMHRGHHACE